MSDELALLVGHERFAKGIDHLLPVRREGHLGDQGIVNLLLYGPAVCLIFIIALMKRNRGLGSSMSISVLSSMSTLMKLMVITQAVAILIFFLPLEP